MIKEKQKKCPICGALITERGSFFPFCSERCKTLDLGAWAQERYKTPSSEQRDQSEEEGDEN